MGEGSQAAWGLGHREGRSASWSSLIPSSGLSLLIQDQKDPHLYQLMLVKQEARECTDKGKVVTRVSSEELRKASKLVAV